MLIYRSERSEGFPIPLRQSSTPSLRCDLWLLSFYRKFTQSLSFSVCWFIHCAPPYSDMSWWRQGFCCVCLVGVRDTRTAGRTPTFWSWVTQVWEKAVCFRHARTSLPEVGICLQYTETRQPETTYLGTYCRPQTYNLSLHARFFLLATEAFFF